MMEERKNEKLYLEEIYKRNREGTGMQHVSFWFLSVDNITKNMKNNCSVKKGKN